MTKDEVYTHDDMQWIKIVTFLLAFSMGVCIGGSVASYLFTQNLEKHYIIEEK